MMIMKTGTLGVILMAALSATQALAAGDAAAGKDKAALCQGCHGEAGISVDPNTYPNLAGQFSGYIKKQIQDFQAGRRNNDTMSPMAATVATKEDLEDIAAYFSSQKPMKGVGGKNNPDGQKIFMEGVPEAGVYGCKNCHGENGRGKGPDNHLFPVIGGQNKAYIVKQLKDLRDGNRTNDPAGMMNDIAKKLSDQQIDAVADYASSL